MGFYRAEYPSTHESLSFFYDYEEAPGEPLNLDQELTAYATAVAGSNYSGIVLFLHKALIGGFLDPTLIALS